MNGTPPKYIADTGIVGAPLKHKWTAEIAADLAEKENEKLESAVYKTHFKGQVALATAVAEWTIWRFADTFDQGMAQQRLDAMWASVIDPRYTAEPDELDAEDRGPIEGPASLTLDILGEVWLKYSELQPTIGENVVALASIARHVVPDKSAFEAWLKAVLQKRAKSYPMDLTHYNEATEVYDPSYEKPVPREFFDPKASIDDAKARTLLAAFLKGLDPKKNPYLTAPSAMTKRGFKGKPYSL
jgi:hypothetical protein